MSTHNICFYGEIRQNFRKQNNFHKIASSVSLRVPPHGTKGTFLLTWLMFSLLFESNNSFQSEYWFGLNFYFVCFK